MQTTHNEVVLLQQGGDVFVDEKNKKYTHKGQRDVRGNKETIKENGSSSDNLEVFSTA